ncbi:PREDICTED: uncharacterized protein LOC109583303 [Amphimedon queenslandica]|uniref:Shugoshin C-terminal domain-containing protein n=1 Tax=Amphimedon queenslandica TaxID=400682 RepID=A0AAN0JBM9_AMPQE|nr:PREDICTED: uncharacterized protein LOC109583303 [Amphimedon queenslandica]|eukprot:XP_019854151.1 PREDICTED: uncharacterized protein LOC109583303 [Amphimedon queenslandica]
MATRRNQLVALRTKNKELVQALDGSRQENRKLFVQNIELKKERQQLMEQVSSLETRLGQLLPAHKTQESLAKVIHNMEQSLTYARTLLTETPCSSSSSSLSVTPVHIQPSSVHIQPSSSTPVHTQPSSSTPVQETHGVQDMETDLLEFETISVSNSKGCLQSTGIHTLSTDIDNTQENISEISSRPRRACASLVQSYQEPSLSSKMRQDRAPKRTLKRDTPAVHSNKRGKRIRRNDHQAGLSDITNKLSAFKE